MSTPILGMPSRDRLPGGNRRGAYGPRRLAPFFSYQKTLRLGMLFVQCSKHKHLKENVMTQGSWWGGGGGGESPTVAHTPDPKGYHYPDQRTIDKGGTGTMIPRALADGRSMAFDGNKAGVVHVDPDAPDGGVRVDLSRVSRDAMNQALAVQEYPDLGMSEAFYKLASGPAPKPVVAVPSTEAHAVRVNPVMPGGHVVPKSNPDGTQGALQAGDQSLGFQSPLVSPSTAIQEPPPMTQQPDGPVLEPQPKPVQSLPQPSQPAPAPTHPALVPPVPVAPAPPGAVAPPPQTAAIPATAVDYGLIGSMIRQAVVEALPPAQALPTTPTPQTASFPPPPAPAQPIPTQPNGNGMWAGVAPPQLANPPEEPRQGLVVGFETLQIPFISGPKAEKPNEQIMVTLPQGMGSMSARYHAVVEGGGCLALVYDTRYEEGNQWAPPDLGEETLQLHCQSMNKSFTILSMGIQFQVGVLDIIVLMTEETPEVLPPPPGPEVS